MAAVSRGVLLATSPDLRPATPASARAELDDLAIARAKRKDPAATRALVDRYAPLVFTMVRRTLPSLAADAHEDLAQDIFLKVFAALDRFEVAGEAKLSTWIATIATRRCIDVLRQKRPHLDALDDHHHLPSTMTAEAGVRTNEAKARVERGLAQLSDDRRAVILLRMYAELSYEAIASALGVDVGTVKSRLYRAKEDLRTLLEEEAA